MTAATTSTTLDAAAFRAVMARHAAGVIVVTTRDDTGAPVGFTATAFSSLSLDPPLVLVCLDQRADCFPAFLMAEHFAVSILAADQTGHARRFAVKGTDKFADVAVERGAATGLPLLREVVAQLECRVERRLHGGDHIILIGEVLRAVESVAEPLVYAGRQFGRFVAHA